MFKITEKLNVSDAFFKVKKELSLKKKKKTTTKNFHVLVLQIRRNSC